MPAHHIFLILAFMALLDFTVIYLDGFPFKSHSHSKSVSGQVVPLAVSHTCLLLSIPHSCSSWARVYTIHLSSCNHQVLKSALFELPPPRHLSLELSLDLLSMWYLHHFSLHTDWLLAVPSWVWLIVDKRLWCHLRQGSACVLGIGFLGCSEHSWEGSANIC